MSCDRPVIESTPASCNESGASAGTELVIEVPWMKHANYPTKLIVRILYAVQHNQTKTNLRAVW